MKEEVNGQVFSASDVEDTAPKRSITQEIPRRYDKQLPEPLYINVIDFFCGCGGASAGFLNTRQSHTAFRILGGVDIDFWALETYKKNIGARGIKADVSELAADPLRLIESFPELNEEAGRPLLFIGCPPCQGFSALRKGDHRDDARNQLVGHFVELVIHFKPEYVVIENVPEILTGKYAHYYRSALARLKRTGYDFKNQVVDMSAYGVPQKRKRAVLIGSLAGGVALQLPPAATASRITVREAISHLNPLRAGEADKSDVNHRAPAHTERLVKLFEKIPADGGDRRGIPKDLHLAAHRRLDVSDTPGFTDVYGRLRWDTPSVTITAKSRSPSSGRFLHPEQHRNITVREAALLQGFPPDYSFLGPPTQQYRQVGEAVPPLFSRFIAASVLDHACPLNPRSEPSIKWKIKEVNLPEGKKLKLVDAFCGAGGLSLGFTKAGFVPAFAFDTDGDAVATYRKNFGHFGHEASVLDVDIASRIDGAVCGNPFVLVGGPPCQGFSHQRKGASNDPRNSLVIKFGELVAALVTKPVAVVVENVTDLELPRGKIALAKLKNQMAKLGYTTFRHILNAADFGSPQLRRRVVLVFLASPLANEYSGPVASTPDRWLTVGEILGDIPEAVEGRSPELHNHRISQESAINRKRIAFVGMGGGRLSIPQELQLPCHAGSYRGHRDVYGRMDWFSHSRTITGGFDSYTRGEYAHPFRHRSITHREGARLQGFPDWFEFSGNQSAVRRQIGNAVPPGMGYALAEAILSTWHRRGT